MYKEIYILVIEFQTVPLLMLITGSQALYELNLHFMNVFQSDRVLSWTGPGWAYVTIKWLG